MIWNINWITLELLHYIQISFTRAMCEKDQSCSTDNKSVALPSDSWFPYLSLILPLVWDIHIYVVFVRLLLILSTKHVTFSNWKPSIKFNVTHRELRKRIEDRKYIYKWPFSLGGQYGCLSFLNIHFCIYFFTHPLFDRIRFIIFSILIGQTFGHYLIFPS